MAAPVSGCYEQYLFWKVASNLNWKGYSERVLLRITAILEPTVKIYEEYLWVIQKPLNYWWSCTEATTRDVLKQKVF